MVFTTKGFLEVAIEMHILCTNTHTYTYTYTNIYRHI